MSTANTTAAPVEQSTLTADEQRLISNIRKGETTPDLLVEMTVKNMAGEERNEFFAAVSRIAAKYSPQQPESQAKSEPVFPKLPEGPGNRADLTTIQRLSVFIIGSLTMNQHLSFAWNGEGEDLFRDACEVVTNAIVSAGPNLDPYDFMQINRLFKF